MTVDEAKPVTYSLQFRGVASQVAPGVLSLRASAPGGALRTVLDDEGVRATYEPDAGEEALLEARMVVSEDSFEAIGSINFGASHAFHFRSHGGRLAATPDGHLRQGAASGEVEGGIGQFENASGRITSNFFISDTGELTDHQLGLVFIGQPQEPNRRRT
ncbi:MAG TPA: hypothetical protein VJ975_12110 [Candidatus Limnocylindria bacterium]|nr:hypothetical protein [Candidatus Limnocylindria bacterium]